MSSSTATYRAHPRSRGENDPPSNPGLPFVGSSPLTRGKRDVRFDIRRDEGLIPAHAGKTTRCPAARPAGRAHPRSRGENMSMHENLGSWSGSSPLTRGKQQGWRRHRHRPGLIPAHAGKTVFLRSQEGNRRAHPRSRGENRMPLRMTSTAKGSSPLTRGKLKPSRSKRKVMVAHPRSRGENSCTIRASRS